MKLFFILFFSCTYVSYTQNITIDIESKELRKAYRESDTAFFDIIHKCDYVFIWNKSKIVHNDIPSTFFFQSNGLYLAKKYIAGEYWIEETECGFKLKIYSDDYLNRPFSLIFLDKNKKQVVRFKSNRKKRLTPKKNRKYMIVYE